MRYRVLFLGVVVGLLACSLAYADVPQLINFQGRLTDSSSKFVPDGKYYLSFKLYTDSTGGTAKWEEAESVTVTKGLFNVILGSVNPIPDSIFNYPTTWLGIQVASDPEMTPRQRLSSLGYSYRSTKADTAAFAKAGIGGGGWVDDGAVVRLVTSTDKVGIGPYNPTVNLEVNGVTDIGGGTLVSARLGHGFNHWTYFGGGNSGRIRGSGEGYLYLSSNPNGIGDKRIYLDASGTDVVFYGHDFIMVDPQ